MARMEVKVLMDYQFLSHFNSPQSVYIRLGWLSLNGLSVPKSLQHCKIGLNQGDLWSLNGLSVPKSLQQGEGKPRWGKGKS